MINAQKTIGSHRQPYIKGSLKIPEPKGNRQAEGRKSFGKWYEIPKGPSMLAWLVSLKADKYDSI